MHAEPATSSAAIESRLARPELPVQLLLQRPSAQTSVASVVLQEAKSGPLPGSATPQARRQLLDVNAQRTTRRQAAAAKGTMSRRFSASPAPKAPHLWR